MRTLYLDCSMGAAGDMLTAALLELLPDRERVVEELNGLGIPGVEITCGPAKKCGISGTHVSVRIQGREESEEMYVHSHGQGDGHIHDHGQDKEDIHDHGQDEEDIHDHGQGEEDIHDHGQGEEDIHDHRQVEEHIHDRGQNENSIYGYGQNEKCIRSHGQAEVHIHGYGQDEKCIRSYGQDEEHIRDHGKSEDHAHEHGEDHIHSHEQGEELAHGHEHGAHHVHHHHSGMYEIEHIVGELSVSERIRKDILSVFGLIAEAESHVHGVPVTDIHFHEVGTMDAVADIAAVCVLMDRLAPDQVVVSPVHVGSGQVKCAHGILPVPAPATAFILKDVPIYGGGIRGELCTPTGAALLKYFATRFGDMPVMRTLSIGYGMGKKDFPAANCVRALLGETAESVDTVAELCCNVDDMTAEAVGFAMEALFAAGALEVYTVAAGMKKSRPGLVLHVMCREAMKDEMVGLLFKYTTTIGIRENISRRYTLGRSVETVQTPYGAVRKKISTGYGVTREKYEYEDLARIAGERGMSISEVLAALRRNE